LRFKKKRNAAVRKEIMNKDNQKGELGTLKSSPTEKKTDAGLLLEKATVALQRLQLKRAVREQAIACLEVALKQAHRETKSVQKTLETLRTKESEQQTVRRTLRTANRVLRAQLKQMTESRDRWKTKFQSKGEAVESVVLEVGKPKYHQYTVGLVWLSLQMQRYGSMSLRGCREMVRNLSLLFQLEGRVPSASTIRNWAIKVGHYRLTQPVVGDEKWVVWMDESVVFAGEKVLLVLGCRESAFDFRTCLTQKQVEVLLVCVQPSWNGESIAAKLKSVHERTPIAYVVSDRGGNLVKACRLSGLNWVSDCSHAFARAFERLYQDSEPFKTFCLDCGKVRAKWCLTKWAAYMPPAQRTKARFMNIEPLFQWAKACLDRLDTFPEAVQTFLDFLKPVQSLIHELCQLLEATRNITLDLKVKGFAQTKKQPIFTYLQQFKTPNQLRWVQEIQKYIQTLAENPLLNSNEAPQASQSDSNASIVPQKTIETAPKRLFCCSDIIESTFGKFKLKINPKNPQAMTPFLLTIANFGDDLSRSFIQEALQNVKVHQIATPKNPDKPSIPKQKKEIFGKKVKPPIMTF
jgi:hypothetical protein